MKVIPSKRSSGFTLIELLVVIGILATLASLVFLGSKSALKAAKAAKVGNNMRNIHAALVVLRDEGVDTGNHNPGAYPPASGEIDDDQGGQFVWWDLCAVQMNIAKRQGGNFDWDQPHSETIFQNPLSVHKLGGKRKEWGSLSSSTNDSHGSYAYNGELGDDAGSGGESEGAYVVRASQLEDASNTIWFGEADDDDKGAGWIFEEVSSAPQGNYKDQVHLCFVDGSVRLMKNVILKKPPVFDFLTSVRDKNYNNQP